MEDFCKKKRIPITNEVDLNGHTKAVTCISVEPAGNRLVTGSLDYAVQFFDFGGKLCLFITHKINNPVIQSSLTSSHSQAWMYAIAPSSLLKSLKVIE